MIDRCVYQREGLRMRRVLIVLVFCILLIAACAPESAPTEEPADPGEQSTAAPVPTESSTEAAPMGPAEEAVIEQLAANLDLQQSDITLVSSEETEFGDACLDVSMEGVMCAQVVTPGRIIVLEANSIEYEYHASEEGTQIQPATLALVWKREGGIAGFCDTLTVFRSGEVFATKCGAQADGNIGTLANLLTSREIQQFSEWTVELGEVQLDASDPQGVADRMVVTMEFFGSGAEEPTESQQRTLFEFAQELYQQLARR
jgi:hypothetical protein